MTCDKAQDAIMLYHNNKKIDPYKSLTLYHHVNKCCDCREFFLMADQVPELVSDAPIGLTESVMAKIKAVEMEPSTRDLKSTRDFGPVNNWLRLAGCLYAIIMVAGLGFLYNAEIIQMPYATIDIWERIGMLFSRLAQIGQQTALYTVDTINTIGGFSHYILAMTVVLGMSLAFMVQREKTQEI